jgi:hypothetical protein
LCSFKNISEENKSKND